MERQLFIDWLEQLNFCHILFVHERCTNICGKFHDIDTISRFQKIFNKYGGVQQVGTHFFNIDKHLFDDETTRTIFMYLLLSRFKGEFTKECKLGRFCFNNYCMYDCAKNNRLKHLFLQELYKLVKPPIIHLNKIYRSTLDNKIIFENIEKNNNLTILQFMKTL